MVIQKPKTNNYHCTAIVLSYTVQSGQNWWLFKDLTLPLTPSFFASPLKKQNKMMLVLPLLSSSYITLDMLQEFSAFKVTLNQSCDTTLYNLQKVMWWKGFRDFWRVLVVIVYKPAVVPLFKMSTVPSMFGYCCLTLLNHMLSPRQHEITIGSTVWRLGDGKGFWIFRHLWLLSILTWIN